VDSTYGIQIWYYLLQQLNSSGRYDDSAVRGDTTKESVANREKQEERSSNRILIVDDEQDIAFTVDNFSRKW
jgi:hypothetical protein